MTLAQIAVTHPTDKGTVHAAYLPFYERIFAALRDTATSVLEIGVDGGGSICMWQEYFGKARISGMDINPKPPYLNGKERITHFKYDAYQSDTFLRFYQVHERCDVVIDDGPHSIESQRWFCEHYPRLLTPGGIAIVEDVQDINECPSLAAALPAGFHHATVDLRTVHGRYDDVLFVVFRP